MPEEAEILKFKNQVYRWTTSLWHRSEKQEVGSGIGMILYDQHRSKEEGEITLDDALQLQPGSKFDQKKPIQPIV